MDAECSGEQFDGSFSFVGVWEYESCEVTGSCALTPILTDSGVDLSPQTFLFQTAYSGAFTHRLGQGNCVESGTVRRYATDEAMQQDGIASNTAPLKDPRPVLLPTP